MKEMYGENKLIIMIIKSLIFFIKENLNEIFPDKKRSFSTKVNKLYDINYDNSSMNSNLINKQHNNNNVILIEEKEEKNENNLIEIVDDDDNDDINEIYENQNIKIEKEKNYFERNEKVLSIESHYNKGIDGNIYKYEVGFFIGKLVVFNCFDNKCNSTGIFDLETKIFKIQKEHNLNYSEHNYIYNCEKKSDSIFKEMIDNNYLDSQVYKEGKSMIVRFYS